MSRRYRLAQFAVALGVCIAAAAALAQTPSPRVVQVAASSLSESEARASAQLVEALAKADAVLLGETHDNVEHHRLQAWLVERLVAQGRRVIVAFEMINTDQTADLARHFAAAPRDADGLGAALAWDRSGWPEWRLYAPIVVAALAQANPPPSPIRAAGLPRSFARGIVQQGLEVLPNDLARRLALAPAADAAALAAHGKDMDASHCGLLPAAQIAPFALAQYARDAQMALSLADAWRETGGTATVVLIAGSGHARTDLGVPLHLRRLAPEMRVLAVGMIEADEPRPDLPFDYVLLTAAEPREDPCAELRARGMPRR